MICPNKHEPGVECADCRGFASVWERLDEFEAPEVTPGFDARLYARIAAEGTRPSLWWKRLLWRPMAPLAAVMALAGLVLFVYPPHATKPSSPTPSNSAEIEQVAQAVDDLDLLTPIDR